MVASMAMTRLTKKGTNMVGVGLLQVGYMFGGSWFALWQTIALLENAPFFR